VAVNFGNPTDLPELLAAVRDKIVTTTGIARHLVFPTLWADDDIAAKPPGDLFVTVRPGPRFVGIPSITAGAGRNYRAYAGKLLVSLFFRLKYTDQTYRDADLLEQANSAASDRFVTLLSALELFAPTRTNDGVTAIVIEPMRNDDGFDLAPHKVPVAGWMKLVSHWDCKFAHRLS
jgi:hypothetical protein